MKKALFWEVLLLIIFLSGCVQQAGSNEAEQAARAFLSAPGTLSGVWESEQLAEPISLEVQHGQEVLLRFSAPAVIRGLEVSLSPERSIIRYHDLELPLAEGDLPEPSVIVAFRDLFSPQAAAQAVWSGGRLSGRVGFTDFVILYDPSSSQPLEIHFPSLSAIFRLSPSSRPARKDSQG